MDRDEMEKFISGYESNLNQPNSRNLTQMDEGA